MKKPFLLIEILIAFLILTLCAIPIVRQPLKMFRFELSTLEKMEMERMADWSFSEIEIILLKNEIPWEKLPKKKAITPPFSLSDATLDIPGYSAKKIKRTFTLEGHGEKKGLKNEIYRMIWVHLYLDNEKFTYRIPVQKISNEEGS